MKKIINYMTKLQINPKKKKCNINECFSEKNFSVKAFKNRKI